MGLLSFLSRQDPGEGLKELMARGAVIVDVRTPGEFNTGHVVGSKNIPLDAIGPNLDDLKKLNVPIIACCASGMRSGVAVGRLRSVGIEAVNGGSWYSVKLAADQACE